MRKVRIRPDQAVLVEVLASHIAAGTISEGDARGILNSYNFRRIDRCKTRERAEAEGEVVAQRLTERIARYRQIVLENAQARRRK